MPTTSLKRKKRSLYYDSDSSSEGKDMVEIALELQRKKQMARQQQQQQGAEKKRGLSQLPSGKCANQQSNQKKERQVSESNDSTRERVSPVSLSSSIKIRNLDPIIIIDEPSSTTNTKMSGATSKAVASAKQAGNNGKENKDVLVGRGKEDEEAATGAATTATLGDCIIPGLTKQHYFKGSKQTASTPTRIFSTSSSFGDGRGELIRWNASGSKGETYELSAIMKDANNNDHNTNLKVHCSCPAFQKLGAPSSSRTRDGKILVCKHLAAALDSVVDPSATKPKTGMNAVVDLVNDDSSNDNAVVVDLVNDGSSNDNGTFQKRKQWARTTSPEAISTTASCTTSRAPPATNIKKRITPRRVTPQEEAPIKLFATPQDLLLRRLQFSNDRSHWCWTQCKTLEEMVFGSMNDNTNNRVAAAAAADPQWIVVSVFKIDFDFLADQLPALLTIPRIVVFYQYVCGDPSSLRLLTTNSNSVDFVQLNPSQPANSVSNPLSRTYSYGTHHTKLVLVGYSRKIRVIVSTANLLQSEYVKAQAAYVEEFGLKSKGETQTTTSEFEETLVHYMESYCYSKKCNWNVDSNSNGDGSLTLTEVLARYDYSTARGVLIPSIPGYHPITQDNNPPKGQQAIGHLKLRQAIRMHTTVPPQVASSARPRPVICQFSSMGSVSENYLHSLQMSMDTSLAHSTTFQKKKGKKASKPELKLKLVFPTVQEIRDSVEGYRGGGTVPSNIKNVRKPFLKDLWRKWSSSASSGGVTDHQRHALNNSNALSKPNNVPHIKSFYQVNDDDDDDSNNAFDWLCITSHNISQAAWGSIADNQGGNGKHIFVRSWELGVFVSPQTLGVDKLILWRPPGEMNQNNSRINSSATTTTTVPMPYNTHSLQPYESSDEPWAWNIRHPIPDRFGRHSLHDGLSGNM